MYMYMYFINKAAELQLAVNGMVHVDPAAYPELSANYPLDHTFLRLAVDWTKEDATNAINCPVTTPPKQPILLSN